MYDVQRRPLIKLNETPMTGRLRTSIYTYIYVRLGGCIQIRKHAHILLMPIYEEFNLLPIYNSSYPSFLSA